MSQVFALLTSDPNLISCELRRSEEACAWPGSGRPGVAGLGAYSHGDVVLQEASGDSAGLPPSRLWQSVRGRASSALLHWIGEQTSRSGGAFDARVPPWRFRQWLFAQGGQLPESSEARIRVLRSLPEFLQRQVPTLSDGEVAFGVFLRKLHEAGALEPHPVSAPMALKLMEAVVRVLVDLYASATHRAPAVSLVASNGSVLVCARQGSEPLWYAVRQGLEGCRPCELAEGDSRPAAALHRRLRSVVVASRVDRTEGWTELPPGSVLAVDGRLEPVIGTL